MQSMASQAAEPQPDKVLMTMRLLADLKDKIVSLNIFMKRSEIGVSCRVLTAYL